MRQAAGVGPLLVGPQALHVLEDFPDRLRQMRDLYQQFRSRPREELPRFLQEHLLEDPWHVSSMAMARSWEAALRLRGERGEDAAPEVCVEVVPLVAEEEPDAE